MKEKEIEKNLKRFNKFKQDKWMPYEKEIIRYYYPQLIEWIETGMIKPSIIAFTSGLGRDIAGLIEQAIQSQKQKIIEEIEDIGIELLLTDIKDKEGRKFELSDELMELFRTFWEVHLKQLIENKVIGEEQ